MQPNIDAEDRERIDLKINGEWFEIFLFEVRGEDELIEKYSRHVKGAIYTFLDCDGTEVFLRGRHFVNRLAYAVLPDWAPEEIASYVY